jgi:hypothetical protein
MFIKNWVSSRESIPIVLGHGFRMILFSGLLIIHQKILSSKEKEC